MDESIFWNIPEKVSAYVSLQFPITLTRDDVQNDVIKR